MKVRQATRGRPLFALLLVIGCWAGMRMMLWDAGAFQPLWPNSASPLPTLLGTPVPMPAPVPMALEAGAPASELQAPLAAALPMPRAYAVQPAGPPGLARYGAMPVRVHGWPPSQAYYLVPAEAFDADGYIRPPASIPAVLASAFPALSAEVGSAEMGSAEVGPAELGKMPVPISAALPASGLGGGLFRPQPQEAVRPRRWSGDGWALTRRDGNAPVIGGPAPASYGASQAGAVLRYHPRPDSGHRPAAYLRTTAALGTAAEREVALGLSARPLADLPVVAAAELRATDQPGGTRLRPAAMVVTELPPFALPQGLRGEAYVQAGYVGGRFSTPFVDGQLRVDRKVMAIGRGELRAGAGAWGGAQKGAGRLDVGPGATMGLGLGDSASARLAVDWRFRLLGDAVPASGPAMTLSAGF